ncbi:unnamed protein product [Heterobilharzia americana]|nr:unnamed protein product [Heterobilharzia americana]
MLQTRKIGLWIANAACAAVLYGLVGEAPTSGGVYKDGDWVLETSASYIQYYAVYNSIINPLIIRDCVLAMIIPVVNYFRKGTHGTENSMKNDCLHVWVSQALTENGIVDEK